MGEFFKLPVSKQEDSLGINRFGINYTVQKSHHLNKEGLILRNLEHLTPSILKMGSDAGKVEMLEFTGQLCDPT